KAHLHQVRETFEKFLLNRLRLRTNAKTQVFPITSWPGRPLDFLGYRIWPTHRKLRTSSIRRISKTLKRLQKLYGKGMISLDRIRQSVISWIGHAKHAESFGLRGKLLAKFIFIKNSGRAG
ncbi:MAG: RNA-dependent DNA polymerase, partial [Propionivibrio sp.]